ncbi:MAG TPA: SCO family protein [Candidatus Baltobacteraceae bacterium]
MGTSGAILAVLVALAPAQAHGAFRGTVLTVLASKGEAVVSRDAALREAGATAVYRFEPATLAKLHAGDRIAATEDETGSTPTLRDVMVETGRAATALSPERDVTQLSIGDAAPNATLTDQDGRPFSLARYRGRDLVIGFIYTRCRDARECPLTTAKFRELQTIYAKRDVGLLEVTLDPEYDTPKVLKAYANAYGADPSRWTFATGPQGKVLDFDAAFGLNPFADPSTGIIHGETLAIVDKAGKIHDLIYTNSWSPAEITAELDEIDGLASNPIARFDLWLSHTAVAMCGDGVSGFDGIVDLLVVLAIFAALGYAFWRLYRAMFGGAR